jgi:aspartyl-tRNA(Asn)/glutamyl-tRNA(Gln) amidotransferase subunit B
MTRRVDAIRRRLPELPAARQARFVAAHGLSEYDAEVLVRMIPGAADYFEEAVRAGAAPKSASNWIQGEMRRTLKAADEESLAGARVSPQALAELTRATDRGEVSSTVAKEVLARMWATGRGAADIIRDEGFGQVGRGSFRRREACWRRIPMRGQAREGKTNGRISRPRKPARAAPIRRSGERFGGTHAFDSGATYA